jgi:hypothetical protein
MTAIVKVFADSIRKMRLRPFLTQSGSRVGQNAVMHNTVPMNGGRV